MTITGTSMNLRKIGEFGVKQAMFRELKQTTTATATGTPPNKRFNEQNNSCARAF